jgi:hypothetical protein
LNETNPPPMDEMVDDLSKWPLLRVQLAACDEILVKPFNEFDTAAIKHQRDHRIITLVSAMCGTLAVLFAIVSLSRIFTGMYVVVFEVIAVAIAFAAVILGGYAALQSRWLSDRHKAERCRLLKFRYLIDPSLWLDNAEAIAKRTIRLREEYEEIRTTSLHKWMDDDALPDIPIIEHGADYSPTVLKELTDYYLAKRLTVQMNFFASRTRGNTFMDKWTRHIPPFFFFISVMAALAHFAHDIFSPGHEAPAHGLSEWSLLLIMVAAAMPVLGAGVRTVRTAYEFARNTVRYRAKLITLKRLKERLPHEMEAFVIFHELWCSEQILESEHREWLRLMIDAEWFG